MALSKPCFFEVELCAEAREGVPRPADELTREEAEARPGLHSLSWAVLMEALRIVRRHGSTQGRGVRRVAVRRQLGERCAGEGAHREVLSTPCALSSPVPCTTRLGVSPLRQSPAATRRRNASAAASFRLDAGCPRERGPFDDLSGDEGAEFFRCRGQALKAESGALCPHRLRVPGASEHGMD